MKAVDFGQK